MKNVKIVEVQHYYKDKEKHVPKGYRFATCGELLDAHFKKSLPDGWYSCGTVVSVGNVSDVCHCKNKAVWGDVE